MVSWLVGHFAAAGSEGAHRFAWEPAAIAGTALATAVLAAFTGALAYTTSGDVRATVELAGQGRQELERHDRPDVVAIPWGTSSDSSDLTQNVRVVNVDVAPALRILVRVAVSAVDGTERTGEAAVPVLTPAMRSS